MKKENRQSQGVSLRLLHTVLVVVSVAVSLALIYSTFRFSTTFAGFTNTTEEFVELHQDAMALMDASDYLTEKIQRFTTDGNIEHLSDYFEEVFQSKRREAALERMRAHPDGQEPYERLKTALEGSMALMDREYYAMRLVIDAKGIMDYPPELNEVTLTEEDLALPSDQKMDRARTMVIDEIYYQQKDAIQEEVQASLRVIDRLIGESKREVESHLQQELNIIRLLIAQQVATILAMMVLTSRLGIRPILRASQRVREEQPLEITGAREFRALATNYNRMYDVYQNSIEDLNYQASHDELTDVYNRAGYDQLIAGIDLSTTAMVLIDIDHFKSINDTCGHKIGDEALQRVAAVLTAHFRGEDYVCRIGGDEFAVLMLRIAPHQLPRIGEKIDTINRVLGEANGNLPALSISVGIAHGDDDTIDPMKLYQHADRALYEAKRAGRHCFRVYEGA